MPLLSFLFLLICYVLSGYGLLTLFGMRLKPAYTLTLSLLLGIAVASVIPFLLQLFYIVIIGPTVFGALLLAALLLNIPTLLRIRKEGFPAVIRSFKPGSFRVQLYEIPFWLVLAFFIFVSVWRCYYLPPTSRDALSGPETIAEYAVREQTMINSFFRLDLWSTNNQFKSPFLISLQIIYKLAGFPFGQVWLSIVFICFTVFLYQVLKERLHPLLAGLLLLLFTMAPEIYAYSFMILYDYSNMVFYFLGLYFLFAWFRAPAPFPLTAPIPSAARPPVPPASPAVPGLASVPPAAPPIPATLSFAGLLLGIATYIRSETLVLVILLLPPVLLTQWRAVPDGRLRLAVGKKIALALFLFLLPSFIGYYLPTQLYIRYYLPVHYDINTLVNDHLTDWSPLFQRYSDIVTRLLFGTFSIHLWGYIFYLTALLFLAELIYMRRFNKEARNWLYAIAMLYLALGFLGFALPMFNLLETTKRALFKMMPLAIAYLANNEILIRFSQRISRWEALPGLGRPKPAVATAGISPAPNPTTRTPSPPSAAPKKPSKKKHRKK